MSVTETFEPKVSGLARNKIILYAVGALLTPVTLAGALWGFIRAYDRHHKPKDIPPSLGHLRPESRSAMIVGSVLIWVIIVAVFYVYGLLGEPLFGRRSSSLIYWIGGLNLILSLLVMGYFNRWYNRALYEFNEGSKFGTARFARKEEIEPYHMQRGIYIGGGTYGYSKQGHLITVGGTRSGKGVNLIIPNLLGDGYEGSWVVTDPKGENARITAGAQRAQGKEVVIINPWNVENLSSDCFNPLDLIDVNSENFADDATLIADLIVTQGDKNMKSDFFDSRAKSLLTGLVMHFCLVKEQPSLIDVWQALRLDEELWTDLLTDMSDSTNEVVIATANEMATVMKSDRTYGSLMATAQLHTDFLKSPVLAKNMSISDFDASKITDGKHAVYVIIPSDKLHSHAAWLRLVATTLLKICLRNHNKRVTFLLDEFAALGKVNEIEVALGTYAGYNISLWMILQNLSQLTRLYGQDWETFLGNTSVKHFLGIRDNFTAEYVSKLFGVKTNVSFNMTGEANSNARALITPDELMTSKFIFTKIDDLHPVYFDQYPYYEMKPKNSGLRPPTPTAAPPKS